METRAEKTLASKRSELEAKKRRLELELKKKQLRDELPHLYQFPWYQWSWDFFKTTKKEVFLVAANQIGKSSTQIRKVIELASNPETWAEFFPQQRPYQFWYLYPTKDIALVEFQKKWEPIFLPRGSMKTDPERGWEITYKNGHPFELRFNTGVSVYFKTYAQDVSHLQSGTVDYVAFDEELPEELWSELNARRFAVNGLVSGVFTPTIGQEFWREVIEERGEFEKMRDAWKRTVSLYDCQYYMDGSESHWTAGRIAQVVNSCKNDAEIQRRVHGRFIVDSGLKYPTYNKKKHFISEEKIPESWMFYVGVDTGQGGGEGHPSAITFLAVNPECTIGKVACFWRGDSEVTTAQDVLDKFKYLRDVVLRERLGRKPRIAAQRYDYANKDFYNLALRQSEPFMPAEKSHDVGEGMLAVLFRNDCLFIEETPESEKLSQELVSLKSSTPKTKAKDDGIDSMRYAVTAVPWNWALMIKQDKTEETTVQLEETVEEKRRKAVVEADKQPELTIENEFESWNELYGY